MRAIWGSLAVGVILSLSISSASAQQLYPYPPGHSVPGYGHPYCPPGQVTPIPTPTPTPTPGGGTTPTPAPTPTPGGGTTPTPTPTPTPGGGETPDPTPTPGGAPGAPVDPTPGGGMGPGGQVDSGINPAGGGFAQAPTGGTVGGAETFNPGMIGDLGFSAYAIQAFAVDSQTAPGTRQLVAASGPIVQGLFKISDNESPRPTNRFYLGYNYFHELRTSDPRATFDARISTIGLEKTFLCGKASVGVRVPIMQIDDQNGRSGLGNISGIFKYAIYDDPCAGHVWSVGVIVTAPTMSNPPVGVNGQDIDLTYYQPFTGLVVSGEYYFLQVLSSLVIPDDSQAPTLVSNAIGLGHRLIDRSSRCECPWSKPFFRYLTATVEAHITTPLDNEGFGNLQLNANGNLSFPHLVVITSGLHIGLGKARITLGVGTPVTGPRVYDVEGVCQINWSF